MFRNRVVLFLALSILSSTSALSQSILNKKVTLLFEHAPLNEVFEEISSQTDCVFSYSNIDDDQIISVDATNISLKRTLNRIKREAPIDYKVSGKYIIVKRANVQKRQDQFLTGSIYDDENNPIEEASIYIADRRLSTFSTNTGSFSLKVPSNIESIKLSIAKENFIDTSLIVIVSANKPLNVRLNKFYTPELIQMQNDPVSIEPIGHLSDSLARAPDPLNLDVKIEPNIVKTTYRNDRKFWERMKSKNAHLKNIRDTLISDFAISFIPPISSNKLLAFNTKNRFSLNIIAGYTKGVSVAEIGGLLNVDDGDVGVFQAAGLANIVTGKVNGVQMGGIYNSVGLDYDGFQMGGIYNHIGGNISGAQIGGIFNRVQNVKGAQISGIFNFAKNIDGLQTSGIIGVALDTMIGAQISGIGNRANHVDGAQIGGILNSGNEVDGIQLAGILNSANNIKGTQISGILNRADSISGYQIGLINFAKHYEKGGPIGLFSFVKNGYHNIEISYDELNFAGLGFRTGVRSFHTHFYGGLNLKHSEPLYSLGLGIGTSLPLSKKLYFDFDLIAKNIGTIESPDFDFNMNNVAFVGLSYQLNKSFGLRVGPTASLLISEKDSNVGSFIESDIPSIGYRRSTSNFDYRGWIGFKASLLFL